MICIYIQSHLASTAVNSMKLFIYVYTSNISSQVQPCQAGREFLLIASPGPRDASQLIKQVCFSLVYEIKMSCVNEYRIESYTDYHPCH